MSTAPEKLNPSDSSHPLASVATPARDDKQDASPDAVASPTRNGVESSPRGKEKADGDSDTSNGDTVNKELKGPTTSVVFAGGSSDPNRTDTVKDSPRDKTVWYQKSCREVIAPAPLRAPAGSKGLRTHKDIRIDHGPDKVPTVFASNDILWNGTPQRIKYFFLDGNDLQHQKVKDVIPEWTWYANVEFKEASSAKESHVRIRFNPNDGSWSYIGRHCEQIASDEPTMNLAWLDKSSDLTANEKAVILHEFGHTLGLMHEHQSPAHGGHAVKNIQAAIEFYTTTQGWSEEQVYAQVIDVYQLSDVSNFSQVDPTSIMHYPQSKELTGLPEDIPYNMKLSMFDKAYMMLQYPRHTLHPMAAKEGWSNEKALEVIKAPKDITDTVLKFLKHDLDGERGEISPVNIRQVIEKWCREAHTKPSGLARTVTIDQAPAQGGIVTPAHGISGSEGTKPPNASGESRPIRAASNSPDQTDKPFIQKLYDQLSTLFCPGGAQYFALQFPTRFLDKESYAYKMDGYLSRFNKPVVVNEAEFALTDALYPVAPIVGGPNGQSLSKNYSKALNSLIPTFESVEVRKQREMMRQWLLKETKGGNAAYTVDTRLAIPGIDSRTAQQMSDYSGITIVPGPSASGAVLDFETAKKMVQKALAGVESKGKTNPRGMTRMEYSDSLMQAYLNDRKNWELQRDGMIREAAGQATADPQAMEKVTRTLAHITAIEEAKLASKYADAVVRGYSHTVRGFMGHLDIKTIAESLQDAKDALRESALSSLYTASAVYPVAMQPADWFESLDTGFTREELSQDPDLIKAAVQAKAQLIDNLENQVANLRGFNRGDPAIAKAAMNDAAAKREVAKSALSQKYSASTVSAIKLALEIGAAATPIGGAFTAATTAVKALQSPGGDEAKKKSVMDILGGDTSALTEIAGMMDELDKANAAVNSASRKLTEQMSEYSLAVAGDTQVMIESIQRQLTAAKRDLTELQESYIIARRAIVQRPADAAADGSASKLPTGNGGSRWSEVHIQSKVDDSYTKTDSSSSSSVSSFKVNFWLGSHSNESSSSSAQNRTESGSSQLTVDVAMRVTYVTVDRSGWFDPSFFEMSKSFMRGSKGDSYTPWSTWKEKLTLEEASKACREDNSKLKPDGYLAAYPIGYILVKDCVIKVTSSSSQSENFKSHFDSQAESSGGFLCFSHSSASRSSADSSASSTTAIQGGVVVRIPGPQILGYMMQLTPEDKTQGFNASSAEDIFIEATDEAGPSSLPQRASRAPGFPPAAAHDISAGTGPEKISHGSTLPAATIRNYNDDDEGKPAMKTSAGTTGTGGPSHGIQGPVGESGSGTSPMASALQTALADEGVTRWLRTQPEGTQDVLKQKLADIFGSLKV